ncbi:unnamed protein product [Spirodela intermedia]|uniref:Molybdenum cofactor sulfurase n=1 Tax=Spirodela intermedia TaxID=51605 RepID=A0A7I8IM62_SPIIN|nr:unnamed protein product [Spirodela intermedia]CAA6658051.1 unnamed protein product [Spirodela intermedia]
MINICSYTSFAGVYHKQDCCSREAWRVGEAGFAARREFIPRGDDGRWEEFLRQFGADYGYPGAEKKVEEIRASEFKRLEGLVYLDHAGATLYSEAQMEAVAKDLTSNVYGNPHSQSDSSMATSDVISAARQQVLELCNASPREYTCIFTSGATAGLKLVGEAFPWSKESCYMYTIENHNSVLGIREYALEHGASALAHLFYILYAIDVGEVFNLFAFPSECNFSGRKFHLDLVEIIKGNAGKILEGSTKCNGRWMVLIDASKGCATEPPDLSRFPADFIVISFYKMFGYPTGLGALIIRQDAAKWLRKTYFSGGLYSIGFHSQYDFVKRRESVEQLFEDGTLSFLSIASIRHGFRIINSLTMCAIRRHTASLATFVRKTLMQLRHGNRAKVCVIYGRNIAEISYRGLGPTIAFNLKRPDGSWFGYREVENLASLSGIQLRTGCFCNPGACGKYLGLSESDLMSNFEAGHVCWDDCDILRGKPTGAVRISFGYMSVLEDARKFLKFVENSFVSKRNSLGEEHALESEVIPFSASLREPETRGIYLKSITIYPIKSCAGFSTDSWPLSCTGLRYDREWLLKAPSGEVLTQKKVPEMSKVSTFIDITQGVLRLESPKCEEKLEISIEIVYEVQEYGKEVNEWFITAIARPCVLVRCQSFKYQDCSKKGDTGNGCRDVKTKLNFVNEAQLLLISLDSIGDLNSRIRSKQPNTINPVRFRPNIVISGSPPYAEDSWRGLQIGRAHFTSLGGCNRCQMINLDPLSGKSKEPLVTLASYRRTHGKILFGILLRYEESLGNNRAEDDDGETWIQVGQTVHPQDA